MISEVYAMASSPGQGGTSGGLGATLIPMIGVMFIFYFILIRPQRRRELEHRKLLANLQKGDEVITQSGIYGKITGIAENVVTVDVGSNIKLRMSRSSIAGLQQDAPAASVKSVKGS